MEPYWQSPSRGVGVAEEKEGNEADAAEGGREGDGHAQAAGAGPGQLLGRETPEVVADVEQHEAAHRDEVRTGPGGVFFGVDGHNLRMERGPELVHVAEHVPRF